MNRRDFLKRVAGFTFGVAAFNLSLPVSAKCKALSPVSSALADNFLDARIQKNIQRLKLADPSLRIGETHCHSTFSDGNFSVRDIMRRAAVLGLDFILITEHLIPGDFTLDRSLLSFHQRRECLRRWDLDIAPVKAYPAIEVSTFQGHLILAFPEEYLEPRRYTEIRAQFARYDRRYDSVETVAKAVKPFGGVSIIPHPEIRRSYPFGIGESFTRKHLTGLVDAIEDVSTGHGYTENYSQKLGLAAIGSSDDHFNLTIGTTVTGYDASRHPDFIAAVKARATRAIKVEDSLNEVFTAARMII